jgi:HAD superfamily hydrolase (TIGR01490 family)
MSDKPPVAFFDFDGTLTKRDSLLPFLRFVAGTPQFFIQMISISPVLAAYATGILPNHVAKEKLLRHCLGGIPFQHLKKLSRNYSNTILPHILKSEGYERFLWHKAQGHECTLVSASLDCYLEPWAKQQGFSNCISTKLAIENHVYTGNIDGSNCYGPEKVERIKALYPDVDRRITYAYGDSRGDREMLALCNFGFLWEGRRFKPV